VKRIQNIKKCGVSSIQLVRAIKVGAGQYGAKVMGMPDRFVHDLVKSLHNALPGKVGSGSALLELLLQRRKKVQEVRC
jgi:hypothetical protein